MAQVISTKCAYLETHLVIQKQKIDQSESFIPQKNEHFQLISRSLFSNLCEYEARYISELPGFWLALVPEYVCNKER